MESQNGGNRSQSLDISKGGGAEKHLPLSERSLHEKEEIDPPPQLDTAPLTQWNHPRINIWRTLTAFLAFFILGAHDGAYGVNETSHQSQQIDVADAARP